MWSFSCDERSPQGIIAEIDLFVEHHNPLLFKHPCPLGTLRPKVWKAVFCFLLEPLKLGCAAGQLLEGNEPS